MDKMLVRYILILFGLAIGSHSLKINDNLSKNDSSDPFLNFKSIPIEKPKRQTNDFDFNMGSFEGSAFFKNDKNAGTTSLDTVDNEDFSGFLPPSSKVTRSNTPDLGTHGLNFDASSVSSEHYQTDSGASQTLPEANADYYSNEDQSSSSQSELNSGINNPTTQSDLNSGINNQQNFIPTKPTFLINHKKPPQLQYNTYSPLAQYASGNPTYGSSSQLPIQTIAPSHQTHPITYTVPYKTQQSHPSRTYAPFHNHNLHQQQYSSPYQSAYNNIHLTTAPTVEFNGRKLALPILQLQTQAPSYVQTLENSPVIFSAESGLQYKTQPGLGVSFDFTKPKMNNQRLGTNAPFLVTHNPRPIQVLPLQTSSSTAQFPQYKGASVSQYPSRGFSKIPNDYQEFKLQPQLHFNKYNSNNNNNNNNNNGYNNPKNYKKPGVHSNPSAQIRTDVEIIDKKKKKAKPPPKKDDDDEKDDESDEDYAGRDSYLPKDEDDDNDDSPPRKNFKESEFEGDFVPSKSYPFKEYDTNFSKSKKSSFNNDEKDDDDDDSSLNLAAKYRYSAKLDDDEDDDENESSERESKSKHKSHSQRARNVNRYADENDEDEEDTDIKEKKNHSRKSARNNHTKKKRRARKDHGHNHEEEYEEPHSKKYHKPTFSNYQSSAEQDEIHSKPRSHNRKPDNSGKNKHRVYRDESGEPSTRPKSSSLLQNNANVDSRSKNKLRNPTILTSSSNKLPKATWKNSYGERVNNPDDESNASSYSQEDSSAISKHSNPRNHPIMTEEYTTRPAHKTPTILTKGLTNAYPSKTQSPLHHHPVWKKEESQKFNFGTLGRPPSSGSQVYPSQEFFSLDFDQSKLHRNI